MDLSVLQSFSDLLCQVRIFTEQRHERFEDNQWVRQDTNPPLVDIVNEWVQAERVWIMQLAPQVSTTMRKTEDGTHERFSVTSLVVTYMPVQRHAAMQASLMSIALQLAMPRELSEELLQKVAALLGSKVSGAGAAAKPAPPVEPGGHPFDGMAAMG